MDEINEIHRKKAAKSQPPGLGIIDSQSVKTVSYSDCRGFDGGRKIKGRKRHIVVDTPGHLIQVIVHAANTHDTKAAHFVLHAAVEKFPRISIFSGDAGYRGTAVDFVEQVPGLKMHISERIQDTFAVLPIRWIVERTFAWLGNFRRLSKDYEIRARSAENMVRIAMLRLTVAKCV
ncbi:putative transposase [Nitrosomonas sp. Nm166]|nr:putative transposase [Nitrosomonas sp. Nm166]